jgi:hypothetical protein
MLKKTITVDIEVTDEAGLLWTYAQHVVAACNAHHFPEGVLRIDYAGSGDSGDVTACSFEPTVAGSAHPDLAAVRLWTCSGKTRCERVEGQVFPKALYEIDSVYRTLDDVLREMAFLALVCEDFTSWEVNEGSEGYLLVKLPSGCLTLEHTEFYQASDTHSRELSLDEPSQDAEATLAGVTV